MVYGGGYLFRLHGIRYRFAVVVVPRESDETFPIA
jgi:hypothetical protein